jgi:hypothetical protein
MRRSTRRSQDLRSDGALSPSKLRALSRVSYERAAGSLMGVEQDLIALAREEKLQDIPGIGYELSE